jgi:hypothetical protein
LASLRLLAEKLIEKQKKAAQSGKPSNEQMAQLSRLDDFLSEMSGSLHCDLWTDMVLSCDPRWEQVRTLAKAVLVSFGWPIEIPPPAREELYTPCLTGYSDSISHNCDTLHIGLSSFLL